MKYVLYLLLIAATLFSGNWLDNLQNGETKTIVNRTCGRSQEQLKSYPDYQCTAEFKQYGRPFIVTSQYDILTESSASVSVKYGNTHTVTSWRLGTIAGYNLTFNTVSILSALILIAWIASEAIKQMDDPLV